MPRSPAAFFSYVRFVDQHEEGRITELRRRLEGEVRVYLGEEFSIFQDREIGWGDEWKSRIDGALDAATFFIPVLTPAFFKSRYCREELETFLERERKLGRRDLVLPIYYVDTLLFNDTVRRVSDPLAEVLATRQYTDWRNLRYEPWTDPQVGRRLAQMAVQIRDALDGSQPTATGGSQAGAKSAAPGRSGTRESVVGSEHPAAGFRVPKEPPTHVVDPLHRGDFPTISAAIKAASPGDRIVVRPGLYSEGLILEKPLEILGDGPREEIVVQAAGKSVLVFQTSMGRVKNLTLRQVGERRFAVYITQGRLELEDCDITSQNSTCVAISGDADPLLRRNRIHDGKFSGVSISDHGRGTLVDNEIFGNGLWGIEVSEGGNPVAQNNRIHDNDIGVYVCRDGRGIFEDCEIFGNRRAGVVIEDKGNSIFRRNRVYGGKGEGIRIGSESQGIFEKNDVFDNQSAGIEVAWGNLALHGSRIHDNKGGGIVFLEGGQGIIEDNEITANSLEGVVIWKGVGPVLRRNRITDNGSQAILIVEGGGGTFEKNDLRGNVWGAWEIDPECEKRIKRSENLE
ncbi:MAG TPA: right-handed parallel beta-helix repeat-containing protein [Thermoanaerobaculia bacterium]|nr:right-handed parallel beta-helix repeat-containing protein [Thermoanaerobaculia bacterium]